MVIWSGEMNIMNDFDSLPDISSNFFLDFKAKYLKSVFFNDRWNLTVIYLSYILKIILLNVGFKHKNIYSVPKLC